jgi:DNA-binding HxlR family transcriptional regulator
MFGPQGFNDLVIALPGRISRSVLANRLRRLETLGLVSRRDGKDPHPAYRLTAVGQDLMATLGSLRAWADTWLPEDPDMLERDPDIVLGWLAQRVDPNRLPERPVVLDLRLHHRFDRRYWLVLQRGVEPYGCLTDPLLDASRYVYLEASMPALLALARGRSDWSDTFEDGSVTAAGDPDLLSRVAEWFRPDSDRLPSVHARFPGGLEHP